MSNYIQNIKKGDHISFEIVFKLWHKKIYAFFLKKTNSKDQAEDLTQLTFIKLWRFKHTLSDEFTLDIQLFKIAKTTLLDYFKKQANDERNLKIFHLEGLKSNSTAAERFDTRQQLETILNRLPPTRKKVFVLSRLQGYSYKEIAAQLSISPRTVEKHLSLAVKQLNGYAYILFLIAFLIV